MRRRRWIRGLLVAAVAGVMGFGVVATSLAAGSITGGDRAGLFDPDTATWHFVDESGGLAFTAEFGDPGDLPVLGDWNCNGNAGLGVYRPSTRTVYLRHTLTSGAAEVSYFAGGANQVPIAGDFNGDKCDTVSFYDTSTGEAHIYNSLASVPDLTYYFGNPADKPFAGDFNKNGVATLGLHRDTTGRVYVRNSHTAGVADVDFVYGNPGDRLVAGQWAKDGPDAPATFRPADATLYFRFANSSGIANVSFPFGESDWMPVSYTLNSAPVAAGDSYSTNEDSALVVAAPGVLGNDTDADGDALTAALVGTASHGTVSLSSNGGFTYTPAADFFGADSFTYKANDGLADSAPATVTITVAAVNDPPAGTNKAYPATEDVPLVVAAPGVLTGASDVDGQPLSAVQLTGPANGALALAANGSLTYTPNLNYNGTDSFTFAVSDGVAQSPSLTATITIAPVNDPPVAVPDDAGTGTFTTDEDTSFTTGSVLANDTDVDTGDVLSVATFSTVGTLGSVTDNGNGTFGYDPNGKFESLAVGAIGTDTFSYTVRDTAGLTSTTTVTVTINGVNDAPTAGDDGPAAGYTTDEDTVLPITANVLANDTDPDIGDVLSVTSANFAGLIGNAADLGNGTFSYDPFSAFEYLAQGESATTTFTYTAGDGNGGSDSATVTMTVTGVNDPPSGTMDDGIGFTTDENTSFTTASALTNDTDVDLSDTLSVASIDTTGTLGLVTDNGNGTFGYDPNGAFAYLANGASTTDTFTYTLTDGIATVGPITVEITIDGVNSPPVAADDDVTTDEDTPLNGDLLADNGNGVDSDPETDPLTVTMIAGSPANGTPVPLLSGATVSAIGAGTFTYDPNGAFDSLGALDTAIDSFTYIVSDGLLTDTATVTVTITGINDDPVADDEAYTFIGNTLLEVATAPTGFPATTNGVGVLDGDVDPEGGALMVIEVNASAAAIGTPTTLPSGAVLTMASDGSFTYLPAVGSLAPDSFDYTVADPEGGLDTGTVNLSASTTDMVWFVDIGATPGGDGRSALPFDSLTAFGGATTSVGDTIYVHSGGLYSGGITLLDQQNLIGGGVPLVIDSQTLESAGSKPVVSSPGAGGDAITLGADNSVRGLNISAMNGTAVKGAAVGDLTLGDVSSVTATGGRAIDLAGGTGAMSVSSSSVSSAAGTGGIRIVSSPGSTSNFLNVNLAATSGITLELANAGSVTINGAIANSGGEGIDISASTNVTATFTSVTVFNPAGDGITLSGTTGSITMSAVDITTTGGASFRASNAGTINVTGGGNTIDATGGIGLEVMNTTIGAGGLTFESISSSGGMSGIILNNTGTSGGLTVTGDGGGASNGSGGLITTPTTDGISLTDTMNVSFTQLNVTNTPDHGIDALRVTNFTFQDAEIVGAGNANDEHGIKLADLHGTSLIEDVRLDDINEDGIELINSLPGTGVDTTTIRRLTVEDHVAGFGEHGVDVQASGTADMSVLVDDSTFTINSNGALGVISQATGSASLDLTISDSTFNAAAAFGAGTIQTSWAGTSAGSVVITGNDINETPFNGITVLNDDDASLDVTITGNDLDFVGAGPNNGNGILLRQDTNGDVRVLITANTIDGFGFDAIRIFSRDSTDGTGSVDATVTGNSNGMPTQFGAGLAVISRDMNSVCLDASANTLVGSPLDDDLYVENDDVTPSSHGISQASLVALSADNGSATVGAAGTITFGQTCALPAP